MCFNVKICACLCRQFRCRKSVASRTTRPTFATLYEMLWLSRDVFWKHFANSWKKQIGNRLIVALRSVHPRRTLKLGRINNLNKCGEPMALIVSGESTGRIERRRFPNAHCAFSQRLFVAVDIEGMFCGNAVLHWTGNIDVNYILSVDTDIARVFLVASPNPTSVGSVGNDAKFSPSVKPSAPAVGFSGNSMLGLQPLPF